MQLSSAKELILVLGGARSGKSSWALRYAEECYQSYLFLATAQVIDEEMAERVKRHKESRGPEWNLLEEPIEIAETLKAKCGDFEAVLLDCLTVWQSNILLIKGEGQVGLYQDHLLKTLSQRKQTIIIVSNEVGLGIVPENSIGRKFRDLAGQFHQEVAALADKVIFLVAGLPTYLKGAM